MNGKIGKYRLLEMVGSGPIGAVYKAFDEELSRTVALRMFGDEIRWDPALKERFHEECRSVAELHHPNIIRLHDHGEAENVAYIIMEMPKGKNFRNVIDERPPLSVEEKLSLMTQAAEGLHFAHRMGMLHRNLRPENLYLSQDGAVQTMDFAIGHLLSSHVTPPGIQWGSRIYISPEQIEGKEDGERSDVFSLGLVFYELFTYLHPFHDQNSSQALDNILFQTQFPTVEQFPELPLGLWPILEKCLAKQPDERYGSMKELLEACGQLRRDLKEDCQAMLVELHTVLPRLKEAAQRPGAPSALTQLLGDIQALLSSDAMTEYLPLNHLLAVLAEHYRTIHAMFYAPAASRPAEAPEETVEQSTPTAEIPADVFSQPDPLPSPREKWGQEAQFLAKNAEAGENPGYVDEPSNHDRPSGSEAHPAEMDAKQEGVADLLRSIEFAQEQIRQTVESSLLQSENEDLVNGTSPPPSEDQGNPDGAGITLPGDQGSGQIPLFVSAKQPEENHPQLEEEAGFRYYEGQESIPESEAPPHERWHLPEWIVAHLSLRRVALWGGGGALALMFILSIGFLAQNRSEPEPQLLTPKAQVSLMAAREAAAAASSRDIANPDALTEEERQRLHQATADVLLQQARLLHEEGRAEESIVFIRRSLELSPDYEPANMELEQVEAEITDLKKQTQEERAFRRRLTNAGALIRAGKLKQAGAEINRLRRAAPRAPEVVALRRRWQTATKQAEQALALSHAQELEQAQKEESEKAYLNRVGNLHQAGDYQEAGIVLRDWITKEPESAAAQQLQRRNEEMTQYLAAFQDAFRTRKFDQALNALVQLEATNPEDPNLPELRKSTISNMTNARATLSVYRLGKPGELMMDGGSLGTGEVSSRSIPIGEHRISIRSGAGREASKTQQFYEGQTLFFVYTSDPPTIRLMSDGDRELVNIRKAKEEMHSYSVLHSHGLFRGDCRGELVVNYFEVAYRPASGSHSFRVPFSTLDLRVKENTIELIQAGGGKSFIKFKSEEAGTARALELIWNKLKNMNP